MVERATIAAVPAFGSVLGAGELLYNAPGAIVSLALAALNKIQELYYRRNPVNNLKMLTAQIELNNNLKLLSARVSNTFRAVFTIIWVGGLYRCYQSYNQHKAEKIMAEIRHIRNFTEASYAKLKKAAKLGSEEAKLFLYDYIEWENFNNETRYTAPFKHIKKLAESNNAEAMRILANCYRNGTGCTKSPEEEKKWMTKSALNGNSFAMGCLADDAMRAADMADEAMGAADQAKKAELEAIKAKNMELAHFWAQQAAKVDSRGKLCLAHYFYYQNSDKFKAVVGNDVQKKGIETIASLAKKEKFPPAIVKLFDVYKKSNNLDTNLNTKKDELIDLLKHAALNNNVNYHVYGVNEQYNDIFDKLVELAKIDKDKVLTALREILTKAKVPDVKTEAMIAILRLFDVYKESNQLNNKIDEFIDLLKYAVLNDVQFDDVFIKLLKLSGLYQDKVLAALREILAKTKLSKVKDEAKLTIKLIDPTAPEAQDVK